MSKRYKHDTCARCGADFKQFRELRFCCDAYGRSWRNHLWTYADEASPSE